ncbi:hypothetical protein V5799_023736, partial [Amblyomma americanum]
MDGRNLASRRAALILLHGSDSSDSDTESSESSSEDSSETDSECEAAVYKRAFDEMFRLPAKRPKVVGFVEDVVGQYSDDEVPYNSLVLVYNQKEKKPFSENLCSLVPQALSAVAACNGATDSKIRCFTCVSLKQSRGVPAKSAETHVLAFI